MTNIIRFNPIIKEGLTTVQVEQRIKEGLVNYDEQPKTKSIKKIIADNFFTYFNFLNISLGCAIIIASILNKQFFNGLKNCLFMGVIIINSIIAVIEEIISKKIIDNLSLINESKIKTVRNGQVIDCSVEELVLDDIIILKPGNQIVADSIIMEGNIEVNESFLTGEPDAISKKKGELLLSGSFVTSGTCYAKIEHVGVDNYASSITREAKYQKDINSVIMSSFESILKIISYLIIPIGIIMFISQYNVTNGHVTEAIYTSVAALIGLIPEGLILLTSSVMAVSVIRLSKYKVLVQQLYCIEILARVDVICLDKTGTLTKGEMKVTDYEPLNNYSKKELEEIMLAISTNSEDDNPTMKAIKSYFHNSSDWQLKDKIAFSSDRKFSALSFTNNQNIYLGAPEYLLKEIPSKLKKLQENYRLLIIGKNNILTSNPDNIELVGYVLIEDVIRKEAKNTLDYFKKQSVKVKIISGDNVDTVLKIANEVGLLNANGINVNNLTDEQLEIEVKGNDIFGRVTPEQKRFIISSLQKNGEVVAMTGDGVNDVLALKQSDCAISIASGAEAARNVSQLVLLNDNFDSLPVVVAEGRRTINNIKRSSSLLLVKTFYTIFLIIFSVIVGSKYFFIPIQLTLITSFTIGIPSFILALEPNHELIKGNFLLNIVSKSIPTALTVAFNVMLITAFSYLFNLSYQLQSTLSVYLTAFTGFIFLYKISEPFTTIRKVLFTLMLFGFIYCVTFQTDFFSLAKFTPTTILITFVLALDSLYIFKKLYALSMKIFHKLDPTI